MRHDDDYLFVLNTQLLLKNVERKAVNKLFYFKGPPGGCSRWVDSILHRKVISFCLPFKVALKFHLKMPKKAFKRI